MMDQQHPAPTPSARPRRASAPKAASASTAPDPTTAAATSPSATPAPVIPTTRSVLTAGWHHLEEEAYHADPCPAPSLSSHTAMNVIGKSLLHAWRSHPRSPMFEPYTLGTAADRGSAAHALLVGG